MTLLFLSDKDQNVVWQGEYSPFGGVTETVGAVEQNLRFPGQYFDAETGLYYNYFRDYDPSTGRYITADPIGLLRDYSDPRLQFAIKVGTLEETGFAGGELNHLYGYVGQNPLYWLDPYGLAEHTTNPRPSNLPKHESGDARRQRDSGNEKGDKNRRESRKKPKGHKGPWPPRIPGLPVLICPLCPLVFPPPNSPPSC